MTRAALAVVMLALLAPATAAAHSPHRVTAAMPLDVIERRVERNLAHSRGGVRALERYERHADLGEAARVELRWHRLAARWQSRTLRRVRVQLLDRMTWPEAVELVRRHVDAAAAAWMAECADSEGGDGRWFWNSLDGRPHVVDDATRRRVLAGHPAPARPSGSSGAGGWLQFMSGTFHSVIVDAVERARRHGLDVPPRARSWFHPLGQAVAAVEMLADGRRGEWTGGTC